MKGIVVHTGVDNVGISKTVMNSVSAREYSGSPGSVFVQDPPTHHYCPQMDRVSLRFDYPVIITQHHGFGDAAVVTERTHPKKACIFSLNQ